MKSVKSGGFHPEIREIRRISPRYHLSPNPPKIIKASVSAKTLQFDECKVGDYDQGFHEIRMKSAGFHADFMKSGGFHVKSKDLLQGIVTLCFGKFLMTRNLSFVFKFQLKNKVIKRRTLCDISRNVFVFNEQYGQPKSNRF